jgi:sugar-specific transcriptional regulator TrmB
MPYLKIYELLKTDYGFRENHILILEALRRGDMTADSICKSTKIPKGRVYNFLNFLVDNKIITAGQGYPKLYSACPWQTRIKDFLQHHFSKTVEDEKFMRGLIKGEEKDIISINSDEEFVWHLRRVLLARKKFNAVTFLLPHLLYTNDPRRFSRFSEHLIEDEFSLSPNPVINFMIKDAFWEAYARNEEFIYIVDEEGLKDYLNTLNRLFEKKEVAEILKGIKECLEKKMVSIFVTKVKNPYYMLVTECEVFLIVIAKRFVEGVLIKNKEIATVYKKMFAEQISKSENLLLKWGEIFGNK